MYELLCASCGRMVGPFQTERQAENFANFRNWSRDTTTGGLLCQSCNDSDDSDDSDKKERP